MKANVIWTYVANFSESPVEIYCEKHNVETKIHSLYRAYSVNFWTKANFHVFWADGSHEKISAERVRALAIV